MIPRIPFILAIIFCLNLAKAQDVSVLFVGNSLTYSNNLPGLLESIAELHDVELQTDCLCYPNYGLEDHWSDGDYQKMIETNTYDFVIFQQGPSSQAYGRESLLEYGGYIGKLAAKNDAHPVYFMVWPSLVYYHTFDGVIKNHQNAAITNQAKLARVGEVWREVHEASQEAGLYLADGFHPSRKGSLLAALVLYKSLFDKLNDQVIKEEFGKQFTSREFEIILKPLN